MEYLRTTVLLSPGLTLSSVISSADISMVISILNSCSGWALSDHIEQQPLDDCWYNHRVIWSYPLIHYVQSNELLTHIKPYLIEM